MCRWVDPGRAATARPLRRRAAPRPRRARARRRRPRPTSVTSAPAAASHAAVFAAEPPPAEADLRRRVARLRQRSGQPHDHVDHDVAQDDDPAHAVTARPAISAASRAFAQDEPHVRLEARAARLRARGGRGGTASRPCRGRRQPPPRSGPRSGPGRAAPDRAARRAGAGSPPRRRVRSVPSSSRARATAAASRGRLHPPRRREVRVGQVEPGEAVRAVARRRRRPASPAAAGSPVRPGSTSPPRTPP